MEEGEIYGDIGELRAVEEGEGENGRRGREGKHERKDEKLCTCQLQLETNHNIVGLLP